MANIFEDKTKTIPKHDNRIVRVEFDKQDLGARKSHISGLAPKRTGAIEVPIPRET